MSDMNATEIATMSATEIATLLRDVDIQAGNCLETDGIESYLHMAEALLNAWHSRPEDFVKQIENGEFFND